MCIFIHMDTFDAWFVGFFDGEGTFSSYVQEFSSKNPQRFVGISINIADKGDHVLEKVQKKYGGRIWRGTPANQNCFPIVRWTLSKKRSLVETIIPIFDTIPLRTAKRFEYSIWRDIVTTLFSGKRSKRWSKEDHEYLESQTKIMRAFRHVK